MENEIWRDISGFEGLYQVSNLGRVKSLSRPVNTGAYVYIMPDRIMKTTKRSGYPTLILRKNGVRYSRQVHRLVAEAFLPNPDSLPIVNHKDFSRENNQVDNLEWCTQKHNVRWSSDRMTHPRKSKQTNTGEKYIRYRTKGNHSWYSVAIYGRRQRIEKTFKTIEEAITFRDGILYERQRIWAKT